MNRRRHLQLVALEARDVPAIGPVALPEGFTATSGRGNLIDGVYQQHSSITVLQQSTIDNYFFTTPNGYYPGENNIENAESIDLTGGSFAYYGSTTGSDGVAHAVRLEVDRLGNVISKTVTVLENSVYAAAGLNGVSVGQAVGKAFVSVYDKSVFLSESISNAVSVTRDGKYIVGTADGKPAGWLKQANGTYQSIAIAAPFQSNGKGELTEVVGTYATGRYFDATSNEHHAAVWDLRDGNILHDLSAYGSTAGGGGIERIGREFVAVFNGANGQSPLVHVVGRNVSFPLGENLPAGKSGVYPAGKINDFWVYDAGNDRSEMAVVVTTTDGKQLFQTFDGDNQNRALGGLPPTLLPNFFTPVKEIETTNGIIVAGYSGDRGKVRLWIYL